MNLTERIYDGFLRGSEKEARMEDCTKEKFVRSCDVAFGAFKLSHWSSIDSDIAFHLVTRYWDYADNNPTADSPLSMDDAVNAMTLVLLDESPEYLLGMPEKEFFLLITQAALDNMDILGMVGSLAGDDTGILIMRDSQSAQQFSSEVHKLLK